MKNTNNIVNAIMKVVKIIVAGFVVLILFIVVIGVFFDKGSSTSAEKKNADSLIEVHNDTQVQLLEKADEKASAPERIVPTYLSATILVSKLISKDYGFTFDPKKASEFSETNRTIRGFLVPGNQYSPKVMIQFNPVTDEIYNMMYEVQIASTDVKPKDIETLWMVGQLVDTTSVMQLKKNFKKIFYDEANYDDNNDILDEKKNIVVSVQHDIYEYRKLQEKDRKLTIYPKTVSIDIFNRNIEMKN